MQFWDRQRLKAASAQEFAAERQRFLDMAEAMAGVGYWRYEIESQTPYWSDGVYAIHGVDRATFDPKLDSAIDFYHADDRSLVVENMQRAIADKTGFDFQLRLVRADGEVRHVLSKATCELDARGDVSALIGVFQDVTDHVESLSRVEQRERQYRLLAENATDIIAEFDPSGLFSYVSPACRQVLGYVPEQLVGIYTWDIIHPDDREDVHQKFVALRASQPGDAGVTVRYRARHARGHWIWLEGRPRAIRDEESGDVISYQDAARDITATVVAELELRMARIEAESAAEAKGDFLANMSHEVRTPLTAMLGFTTLIKEQPELSAQTLNYVDRAVDAGQSLLATVNDILDFSKLEKGQVEIEPAPVALGRFVGRTGELMSNQAFEKGLDLNVVIAPDAPEHVMIDSHRVRQLVLNLVANAIKFTDDGRVDIEVAYDCEKGRLTVRVSDTGIGIPAHAKGRLFQRFSQVDESTTRRHRGTGLGLAICRGLVDIMDGEIGVESELGKGSTFWFTIPAERVLEPEDDAPACSGVAALPPGCRVLLVDDSDSTRAMVSTALGAMKADVSTAPDGVWAMRLAMSQPFDLILMDCMLPGPSGVHATRQIRHHSGPNQDVPILALTSDPERAERCEDFDGVIAKPLKVPVLVQAMCEALYAGDAYVAAG